MVFPASTLLQWAERHLLAWTRLKRAEPLPIVLHRRRIYVVPSRFGLIFSSMLLVMLLGALNYANNPGLLLTCLLGAAAYQSVFAGFRALYRLELKSIRAQPCHAGNDLRLSLRFGSGSAAPKRGLRLRMEGDARNAHESSHRLDLSLDATQILEATLPTVRRGWLPIGRLRVWSEYPYGLFHVWSWLYPEQHALIYPRIEADAPPLPLDGAGHERADRRHGDEFGGLREYRAGDPHRWIAWKNSARHEHLLVKEFESPQAREVVLDWQRLAGLDVETRISRLAAWIERAETDRIPYRLYLPETRLGPALGDAHRHACLRELALLPQDAA